MMTEKKWLIQVGWVAYALTWVTLFANIAHDWLTRQWVSPLSIIFLALLSSGTIVQLARGEPIIQLQGAKDRFLVTLALILTVVVIILGWVAFNLLR